MDISHKKMDQLVGFLLHPHFLKLAKNRKNVEIHPHFQSAFGTADPIYLCTLFSR